MTTFNQWGLSPALLDILQKQGIVQPTPVQEAAIPVLLTGQDVIAQAQTGTGKTLAFLLPIIEKIRVDRREPQAMIITPTRELAIQITAEARKLTNAKEGLSILAAYGGQDVERQLRKLENGTQLVIGTPGRLLDHLRRGSLTLGSIRTLVLDEADQMLHMGFLAEVESIIRMIPRSRQMMLFSATMPDNVKRLAKTYMNQPKDIKIAETSRVTLDSITQIAVECTDRNKQQSLIEIIKRNRPYLAVIFCRTKRRASVLNEALQEAGFKSDELHGDLSQSKREQVMRAFREAKLELLVATDVAARGIDVEGVTHVFNYDIPQDVDSYIHRIGRTGRAGETGLAITFVAPRDIDALRDIERGINKRLERQGGASGKSVERSGVERDRDSDKSSRDGNRRDSSGRDRARRGSGRNSNDNSRGRYGGSSGGTGSARAGRSSEGRGARSDEGRSSEGRVSRGGEGRSSEGRVTRGGEGRSSEGRVTHGGEGRSSEGRVSRGGEGRSSEGRVTRSGEARSYGSQGEARRGSGRTDAGRRGQGSTGGSTGRGQSGGRNNRDDRGGRQGRR